MVLRMLRFSPLGVPHDLVDGLRGESQPKQGGLEVVSQGVGDKILVSELAVRAEDLPAVLAQIVPPLVVIPACLHVSE